MTNALISGASGLIGSQLLARLGRANILTRRVPTTAADGLLYHSWQPETEAAPAAAFNDVSTVFHLAGEPIAARRWTAEQKRRISDSRVLGTRNLVRTIAALSSRPATLVIASAVGIYGDRADEQLDESSVPGSGFLADVARQLEEEALSATQLGVRVVCLRFGMVLDAEGGALARLLPSFRLGLGGPFGNGQQWMSWIHIDDAVSLLLFARDNGRLKGAVNAVAPEAITNRDFTQQLARVLKRPAALRVPAFALRLGLGEMGSLLLTSQRVRPVLALKEQFTFRYPTLKSALLQCIQLAKQD